MRISGNATLAPTVRSTSYLGSTVLRQGSLTTASYVLKYAAGEMPKIMSPVA